MILKERKAIAASLPPFQIAHHARVPHCPRHLNRCPSISARGLQIRTKLRRNPHRLQRERFTILRRNRHPRRAPAHTQGSQDRVVFSIRWSNRSPAMYLDVCTKRGSAPRVANSFITVGWQNRAASQNGVEPTNAGWK